MIIVPVVVRQTTQMAREDGDDFILGRNRGIEYSTRENAVVIRGDESFVWKSSIYIECKPKNEGGFLEAEQCLSESAVLNSSQRGSFHHG